MNLSTLARVKVATGNTSGTTNDDLLEQLLVEVSGLMENEMQRHAEQVERTEVVSVSGSKFSLRGVPLDPEADVEITSSSNRDFSASDAQVFVEGTDFVVEHDSGLIHLLNLPDVRSFGVLGVPIAPAFLQVTYTGGLATTPAGILTAYPTIAGACDRQVAHAFRRKDSAGMTSQKGGGDTGEAEHSGEYGLLKSVREVCAFYRRQVFV